MERPKNFDRTPQTIENIKELIDGSAGAKIPVWAAQLHEVPFQNEIKVSDLYYSDRSCRGQFDAFLRNDALGKKDFLGSAGTGEIQESVRQLTEIITERQPGYSRMPNSLKIGDIKTLKDGVIRRMGLSPLQVFIVRKLFGYESEDGLAPRAWARNLESISIPILTPDLQMKEYFSGVHKKYLSDALDTVLTNNFRHAGKQIIFETLQMVTFPTVNKQTVNVDVMGNSLPFLLGEGLLDEIDGLDTVTRKTIILRLFC